MKRQPLGLVIILGIGALAGAVATRALQGRDIWYPAVDASILMQHASATSRTLLPDGHILAIGGDAGDKLMPAAEIFAADHHVIDRSMPIQIPRHFHTATAMPDGRILVWGGIDARGKVIPDGEWFDSQSKAFTLAKDVHLTPRAGHTATVLTDGRLLIAGGWVPGKGVLRLAELFNPETGKVDRIDVPAGVGRTATLMADGRVAFQGGYDESGKRLADGAIFDPHSNHVTKLGLSQLLAVMQPPAAPGAQIVETIPGPGLKSVSINQPLAVRFSAPMDLTTLTEKSLSLLGPQGAVDIKIHPAEEGRLAFIVPDNDLLPDSFYALYVNSPRSRNGDKVPLAAISFDTAKLSAAKAVAETKPSNLPDNLAPPLDALTASAVDAEHGASSSETAKRASGEPIRKTGYIENGAWYPGRDGLNGHWRVNRPLPPLPTLGVFGQKLPAHTTAFYGQVLQIDDKPVANVEITIGAKSTRTDDNGLFLLIDPPAGRQEMFIDGTTAGRGAFEYGQLVMGVDVQEGKANTPSQQIFLPKINPADRIAIDSPTAREITITHPELPGLEIHIPAGSVIRDHKGRIVKELALVPTPVDRAPYPVPTNFPVYFTLQPGGAMVLGITQEASKGIRVVYPNYMHAAPGTESSFWVYDPQVGWKIYGKGRVSADGRQVIPDSGVALYVEMGAGQQFGGGAGGPGPGSGGGSSSGSGCGGSSTSSSSSSSSSSGSGGDGSGSFGTGSAASGGDPGDLATGRFDNFTTDIAIDDVMPIKLTRSYSQQDAASYGFGVGMNFNYGLRLVAPDGSNGTHATIQLILPNGIGIPFTRIAGSGPYGAWKNTTGMTDYFGAIVASGGSNPESYTLTMPDGTAYVFYAYLHNYLTAIRDRFGNTLTLTYSDLTTGQISRITSPSGRYLSFTYDGNNHVTQVVDHTGRTIAYAYNPSGTLKSVTYPDATTIQYGYDPVTNYMTTVQDRRGNTIITNQYDSYARLSHQTLADGAQYTFTYTTDSNNKITAADVTDPLGIDRHVTMDAAGFPLTDTYGYGQADARTYSFQREPSTELISQITDPLGRVTHYTHDASGYILSKTFLAGTSAAVTYSYTYTPDYHQTASVTDPLGHTRTGSYTGGCLTQITDALGHTTTKTCNGAGQVTSVTDPLGHTSQYGYSGYDLASITDALSRATIYNRDDLGRVISMIDPLGNLSLMGYDTDDRVLSYTNPNGFATVYGYDGNSNLITVTDPIGGVIGFSYDSRNRNSTRTDDLIHSESWTYDGLGNWLIYTDRNGQQTTASYDDLGRLFALTYADGTSLQYGYDAANRVTSVTDSVSGTIGHTYDGLDRLTLEQSPQGSISYGYDTANRRTSMQVTGQTATSYTYDAANRLTNISAGAESIAYAYDAANRTTSLTLPNGVQTVYGYDTADELTTLNYTDAASTALGALVYGYDNARRRVSATGSWSSDQLPVATTTPYQYNAGNRIIAGNGYTPLFDSNGQLTQDGKGNNYIWNARHQLLRIVNGPSIVASFQYDGIGRRIGKTISAGTTNYLYDGQNAAQEQQGGTFNNLLSGLEIDQIYARTDTPGRLYFLRDALNSTIALTDSNGAVQQRYHYDPYGNYTTQNSGGGIANPYMYTGREDDGTGMYYYRERYYSPALQRFISEDPIGLAGGQNVYAYVGGDPISFTDPQGLQQTTPGSPGIPCWWCGAPVPHPWHWGGPIFGQKIDSCLFQGVCSASGTEDCYQNCYATYEAQVEVCKMFPSRKARQQCYSNALNLLGECQRNCK